jgi:hypothetical protein
VVTPLRTLGPIAMKNARNIASASLFAILLARMALADPPGIRAVQQKPNHCGVACAETILRSYGDHGPWATQEALAAAHCARVPELKVRRPATGDCAERYYPDFKETYQSLLAEMLIDHGYCVISTRSSQDRKTGAIRPAVWDLLRDHLRAGHLAILHVPGHYLAATGLDERAGRLYFVDPSRVDQIFSAPIEQFVAGESFHKHHDGRERPGWDGRALIFWRGEPINRPDRCPVCGQQSPGETYSHCKACRCFIDRRPDGRVQRAIDFIASSAEDLGTTRLSRTRLRSRIRALFRSDELNEQDVRQALLHYPLVSVNPESIITLHRHAESNKLDLSQLTFDELIEVVAGGDRWHEVLLRHLSDHQ